MGTALRRRSIVAAFAVMLTVTVVGMAPAHASPASTGAITSVRTANVIDDGAQRLMESKAVQWLLDNIAITQMKLSPSMKKLVNWVIKLALPAMCPLLGQAADPKFATAITNACLTFGKAADPWGAIVTFTPYLCGFGWLIFPDYANLLYLACQALM